MRVEVLRAFLWDAQVQPVGAVLEVTARQAAELAAMGKARRAADEPPPAPPGPMTTESAGEIVAGGRRRKDKDDAGKSSASV